MNTDYGQNGLYIERQLRQPSFGMNYEHTHSYCEIYYLKNGECTYSVRRRRYHLVSGDLFIVKAQDPHSTYYEGASPSERIVIACDTRFLPTSLFQDYPDIQETLNSTTKVVLTPSLRSRIETLFDHMLYEKDTPDDYSSGFMLTYTINLLLLIRRGGVFVHEKQEGSIEISPVIEQAINYIALNYSLPLTLDDMAARFGLCPSYFSKKFKLETGSNFKEYLNYIRLRQATQMLLTTDDSITKIALNCGFNSSNYFKDCFRKKNNESPRVYRMTHA